MVSLDLLCYTDKRNQNFSKNICLGEITATKSAKYYFISKKTLTKVTATASSARQTRSHVKENDNGKTDDGDN
ncbi:hypothetical protein ACTXT7_001306 [Hymenolepis weldensis]